MLYPHRDPPPIRLGCPGALKAAPYTQAFHATQAQLGAQSNPSAQDSAIHTSEPCNSCSSRCSRLPKRSRQPHKHTRSMQLMFNQALKAAQTLKAALHAHRRSRQPSSLSRFQQPRRSRQPCTHRGAHGRPLHSGAPGTPGARRGPDQ